jgi:undecaprenyl diphosphate synthase
MHLGIIMDGNRTWAGKLGLDWIFGHRQGVKALEDTLEACPELGIDTLTVYAFSTENFKRTKDQVEGILGVIAESAIKYKEKLIGKNVRARVIGKLDGISKSISEPLQKLEEGTKNCNGVTLQICVNYGGRNEIVRAVQKLVDNKDEITEENLSKYLDVSNDPDLIIRPGGQQRLSNFLLWQSAYSELYFTDKLWPDFNKEELTKIIHEYAERNRKFGK